MGISRDSKHKRRLTGGRMPVHRKKRGYERGRPPANTKLIMAQNKESRVRRVRVRGGNSKFRALRLNQGNFVWGSEGIARKTKITDIVYNASNNELVRTKTIVKNCIVQIDSNPFKNWYGQHYGIDLSVRRKKDVEGAEQKYAIFVEKDKDGKDLPKKKQSRSVVKKFEKRRNPRVIDERVEQEFQNARLLAVISSRPGQSGRADGYILEGKELEFYIKKIESKRKQ